MNVLCRQLSQLGHPPPHIVAIGIKTRPLQHRRKHAEIRCGIRPAPRAPLPAERVAREIGIDQRVPKPRRAVRPIESQVFHQKRRHHHAHAVVHPACRVELPHPRIDDRIARLAALPCPQFFPVRVLRPPEFFKVCPQRPLRRVRKMKQQVMRKLPPPDLAQKNPRPVARRKHPGRLRLRRHRRPHLPRPDFPEMQPRRKHRGPVAVR